MSKRRIGLVALAALLFATGVARAQAPQVLALMETPRPVEMTCEDATCRAELSSFCLQQERVSPLHGTLYTVAEGGWVEFVVRDGEGRTRRLAAADLATLRSARGFGAVTIEVPRSTLGARGAVTVAVAVGPNVSLLPAGFATDEASRRAAGVHREVGQKVVEAAGRGIRSVRVMNAMINRLPRADLATTAGLERLWREAWHAALEASDAADVAPAREAFDDCAGRHGGFSGIGFGRCLKIRHDAMLERLNRDYWEILGAGS